MADGIVQVAPDSTGKKIDSSELTVGANTVERQRINIASATVATDIAGVGTPNTDADAGDIALATEGYLKAWNGTSWDRVRMFSLGGLQIAPAPAPAATTGAITTAATTVGPVTMAQYDGLTVVVSGTYAGVNFGFWASNDNAVWFPVAAVRCDSGICETTTGVLTANTTRAWDISLGEALYFRIVSTAFTSGSAAINIMLGMFASEPQVAAIAQGPAATGSAVAGAPILNGGSDGTNVQVMAVNAKGVQGVLAQAVQPLRDAGRTAVIFSANSAAAGATGVETAITLTKSAGTAATSAAATFVVTSGKTFRITAIMVATRGNATATAQITTFNLRMNTAGAVTTTSTPILMAVASATPATASAWDRVIVPIPDGFEILGTGTLQIGITAAATFTTNAPTWYVNILGFEY
jgi:hypothetical protein